MSFSKREGKTTWKVRQDRPLGEKTLPIMPQREQRKELEYIGK